MKEFNIINAHAHLDDYNSEGIDLTVLSARLRADMKRHGISHAAVMAGCHVDDLYPGREELFEFFSGSTDIVIIAGFSLIKDTVKDLEIIEEGIKSGLVRGIKFFCGYEYFYPFDERANPVYELCEKYNIPIFIHTGVTMYPHAKLEYAHPLHVDRAAVEHPNVTFVICHLGYPWLRDTSEVMRKNKNVYADLSGVTNEPISTTFGQMLVRELTDLRVYLDNSLDKVLFGSDWPLFETQWYLDLVNALPLAKQEKENILSLNAKKLLKIT